MHILSLLDAASLYYRDPLAFQNSEDLFLIQWNWRLRMHKRGFKLGLEL
jgi:hypothetical protein